MTKLNVTVLMGGTSSERDISLSTGKEILNALDRSKYRIWALDTQTKKAFLPASELAALDIEPMKSRDGETIIASVSEIALARQNDHPDVVLIAMHGKGGEDGTIQGFLETAGIPYTGSGVLASALAMDKSRCKTFLSACGVKTPAGITLSRGDEIPLGLPIPAVVKPALQGSSDGLSIVSKREDLESAVLRALEFDSVVLVEEFVSGIEITSAVLGNEDPEPLPLIEIIPAKGVYDREAKYTPGATKHVCPARLAPELTAKAQAIAVKCHTSLGCRGMSRTDMIVAPDGEIYALEVNTIPGMTPTSLLPEAAAVAGYSFSQLLDKIITFAV